MSHKRGRLPIGGAYAIAIVALIVALASGAYAAITLEKNSVKSKHIKDGQVKTNDLAANAVDGSKVADNALTGADIAELTGADIAELTGADIAELTGADIAELTGADIAELGAGDIGELSGAELPIRWAFVSPDGTIGPQSGGITLAAHSTGTGIYRLDFGSSLEDHAVIATGFNNDSQVQAGICGLGPPPQSICGGALNTTNHADVLTESNDGTNTDKSFWIVAIP